MVGLAVCGRSFEQPEAPARHHRERVGVVLDVLTLAKLLAVALPDGMTFTIELGGVTISACRE